MNLTVEIPDEIAWRLSAQAGGDLSRRATEAFLAEEYRQNRLTKQELQQLLGMETGYQLDGFLKAHDICIDGTPQDFERGRRGLEGPEKRTGADLIAAIQRSPYRDLEIEPERYRLPVRDVAL
jgi:hypothetical protein